MSSPDSSAAEADPPPDWTPPAVEELASDFPALEIESLLALGGMSAVYLARQRSLDRRVVLKVLPVEIGADPEAAERFMREARVLAKLRDPGIVEIYDSGLSPGGHLFLVLEWEEGGDLRHWADGEVALDEALGIGESVCAALASAHAESIIHGDIKPDNIFIDGKGRLKVGDFGLADFGEGRAVFHSPGYTAPEILMATAGSSPQSDLYATGAMVFELIHKCVPPDLCEERASMLKSLPPAVSRVLGQMLDENPEKRPATAEACRKALADARRALNAVPAPRILPTVSRNAEAHYSPSFPTPRRRSARRTPSDTSESGGAGKLIAAAAAVILIAGGVWMVKYRNASDGEAGESKETAKADTGLADSTPSAKEVSAALIDAQRGEKEPDAKETPPPREKEIASARPIESIAVPVPKPAPAPEPEPEPETSEPEQPEPIDPALIPLRKKYTAALTTAAKAAEQAAASSRLLAILTEISLIEKGGAPPDIDAPGTPPELAKLRAIYRKEAEALAPAAVTSPGTNASSGKPPVGMPADAIPFKGKWYRYYTDSATWHTAKEKCERVNGRLAVVTDQETWTFVKGMMGSKWTWLGATDEKNEGVWIWLDGSAMSLTKWQSKEPNNTDAKQHYLRASSKGWRDDAKQAREIDGYICEWLPQ